MSKPLPLLAAALASATALAACALGPRPATFAPVAADQAGPELDNYGEAIVPARGLIVVQGDDVVYGTAVRRGRPGINGSAVRRATTSVTEAMRQVLHGCRIVNRGFPDDSIVSGAKRWAGEPVGDLLILSYGFGDARAHTPSAAYTAAMQAMIRRAHAQGAAVFIVPSPSVTNPVLNGAVQPYAALARTAALQEGAEVFEPDAEIARVKAAATKGAAQSPLTYVAIAGGLTPYIKVAPGPARTGPAHTGHAGSGATATVRVSPDRAS